MTDGDDTRAKAMDEWRANLFPLMPNADPRFIESLEAAFEKGWNAAVLAAEPSETTGEALKRSREAIQEVLDSPLVPSGGNSIRAAQVALVLNERGLLAVAPTNPTDDGEQRFKCRWCGGDIRSNQFEAIAERSFQEAGLSLHEDYCKSRPADARFNYQGDES